MVFEWKLAFPCISTVSRWIYVLPERWQWCLRCCQSYMTKLPTLCVLIDGENVLVWRLTATPGAISTWAVKKMCAQHTPCIKALNSCHMLSLSRRHVLKTRSERRPNTLLEFTSTEEPMELQGASKRKPSTKALISRTGSSSTWSASGQGHKTNLWWWHQTYYVRWCSSSQDFISSLILAESSTQQQHRAVLLIDATRNSTIATKRLEVHLEKGKQTCKPLRQQWPYDLTAVPALAYQALPVA